MRINGDIALLKGIMKEMLEEDERTGGKVLAHDFIEQHTEGFRGLRGPTSARRAGTASSNRAASRREQIHEAAQIAIKSERMICSWAMGITQHKTASPTSRRS